VKRFAALAAAGLMVFALVVPASAQNFNNSAHDFGAVGAWNAGGQSCSVCHTPHGATVATNLAPLWGHTGDTDPAAGRTFTAYSGFDIDAADAGAAPDGTSVLCLGCHDGVGYLDSFGGATGTQNWTDLGLTASANLGQALTNDHPISITHDEGADTELVAAAGLVTSGYLDANSKVQCTSCHDVHNYGNFGALLKVDNAADALCKTCHNKG
jgi:predicted CXXCH cytochrome family protein